MRFIIKNDSHDYGGWEDVQLASWRPKKADGEIPVQKPAGLRIKKNQCFQAGGVPSYSIQDQTFLFYSGLHLIGRWPSTLGRKICFMQLTNSNTNVIPKHFHRHTKKNVWPNIWVSCGSVKRTQNYPSQYCSYGH